MARGQFTLSETDRIYDPSFTWKVLQKIEEKHILKEERTMPPLQITRERLLQEGLQKGLQKGRQEGRQEEKQSVILKMLKNNMDISTIAKITESTENKIREIQKKLNNLG